MRDITNDCMHHVVLAHASMFMVLFGFSTRRVHSIYSLIILDSDYDLEARRGSDARHHGGHGHDTLQGFGGA